MAGRTPHKPPPTRFAPAQASASPVQTKATTAGHHPPPTKFGPQTFQTKPTHTVAGRTDARLAPPTRFGPQALQAMKKSSAPSYKELNAFTRCAIHALNGAQNNKLGLQGAYELLIATAKNISSKAKQYSYDDDETVEAAFAAMGATVTKGQALQGLTLDDYMATAAPGRYAVSVFMGQDVSHIFLLEKAKKKSDPEVVCDSEDRDYGAYAGGQPTFIFKL